VFAFGGHQQSPARVFLSLSTASDRARIGSESFTTSRPIFDAAQDVVEYGTPEVALWEETGLVLEN
jgi:hypothetical protein